MLRLALCFGAALLMSASSPPAKGHITLAEAKKYAIANNYEIVALREAVQEARAGAARANASFYPTLGVAAGADSLANDAVTNKVAGVAFGYVRWNVFKGFGDVYRSKASNEEQSLAEVRLKKAEFRVGAEVEKAFHQFLFEKSKIALQKEAIELNRSHSAMARKRRSSGLVSNSDLMEFEIADALLKSELVSREQALEIARIDLRRLFGREVGDTINPTGSLQHQHLKGKLMNYINRIKDENEQVLVLRQQIEQARFEKGAARSNYYPQVDFEARAGYEPLLDRPSYNSPASVRAMVVAKLDLFSGFSSRAEVDQASANLLKLEARLRQAILDAVTGTERLFRQIKSIQERVDLEEQNTHRTEKFYNSVLAEYKRGVKGASDLRGAAETLIATKLRQEEYKFEFLQDRLRLEQAIGGPVQAEVLDDHHH